MIGTFKAHLKNMIKGATEGHIYQMKICSSHFPMNVELKNNELSIKNLLGETIPRIIKIEEGVDVKIEENIITRESSDKELAGQTAASIELKCKIPGKDKRIFQDGIYIISKSGKMIK